MVDPRMTPGDTFRLDAPNATLHAFSEPASTGVQSACGRRFAVWEIHRATRGKPCAQCAAALERVNA